MGPSLVISEEVRTALAARQPVVALESSIVAHGFPRPDNLAVGQALLTAVRNAGAVPAMIAVFDGIVRVGLNAAELERLAAADRVLKCSTRDLAWLVASRGNGGTTVAATAWIAAQNGIAVFATGGIGGVHRSFAAGLPQLDISADLPELGRTSIAVVASGAKSILDLPATLELLETYGVAVIGFGTDEFPAFHSRHSGLRLRHRVDEVAALAEIVRAQRRLALPGAVLICHPPPAEVAMSRDEIEALVQAALAEASAQAISGAMATPYLLAALDRLSGGRTRRVNHALAVANATLAGRLAAELGRL